MLRKFVTGLFISLLVSLSLLNLSSRLQDETAPVDLCVFTSDDPLTRMDDLIRQYLLLSQSNQQTQTALRILSAFNISAIIPQLAPDRYFSEISWDILPEKHTSLNLLEFCCRLNI